MTALALLLLSPAQATTPDAVAPAAPVRVVDDVLIVPAGLDPEVALASVANVARVFELYEPRVPWVPGVRLDLGKEVVSMDAPIVLELPVSGAAVGKPIEERARVTATVVPTSCGGLPGRTITLDFETSTYNIERRVDRIEIDACLDTAGGTGEARITATGRMYAGYLPEDPKLDGMMESIGAKAIQGAFLRQVDPILDAVEAHWAELETAPAPL